MYVGDSGSQGTARQTQDYIAQVKYLLRVTPVLRTFGEQVGRRLEWRRWEIRDWERDTIGRRSQTKREESAAGAFVTES